ncbi:MULTISPECIES: DoxX family protein [Streptomyces]|uniref:DoxX family protein n=1 Tax=Streptomyces TaxID=1883 RepID=UPI0006FCEE66|nr:MULTISPECIES: DoxX family protein [unclassified Streptomyces]KQX79204.1 transmembrane invasion protein [Streptomyces sp. Root1319]KQZ21279.1 transmembrane invasion protein [Streptomyces sp. Root55]WRY81880.1 DoxX family protein [Streptomyces clavifer]
MNLILVIATVACIAANLGIAIADYGRAPFVLANSAEVRLPSTMLPYLATLKLAGAAGLVIGLLGAHPLGLAAGVGLVFFFTGAVTAHIRARVFYNIAFPGVFLVLAAASTAFFASKM